jgi:hypothetical protein
VRSREAALKRMLSTPHQPHQPIGKKKASPKSLAANGGKIVRGRVLTIKKARQLQTQP